MSNSSLICYTRLSPNCNPRTEQITKITPHYMAGNCTVETCGEIFAPSSRQASSNYGIGSDGRIAMYVPEDKRAWTSSSKWNDQRAVTIEVANVDSYGTITDAAWNSLVNLCVDICQRNGIPSLNFTGDQYGSLTWHCMFTATSCPGQYIKDNTPRLIQEVNDRLNGKPQPQRLRNLQIFDWGMGNTAQMFYVRPLDDKTIALRSVSCWDWISDPNSSTEPVDAQTWGGANGEDGNKDPRAPQILTLEETGYGTYFIHPQVAPNLSLDVDGGNSTNGTKVQWWYNNGLTPQMWSFVPTNETVNCFYLINAATHKALDVPWGGWYTP